MKSLQKLLLPLLVVIVGVVIYFSYFHKEPLGTFSSFDPNNNAVKEITVQIVQDRGISRNGAEGVSTFYAMDKNGQVLPVSTSAQLPADMEKRTTITLKGHLERGAFHAHEVE